MGRVIPLIAKSRNGKNFPSAYRVVYVQEDYMKIDVPNNANKLTKVTQQIGDRVETFLVAEKGMQIEAQRNPSSTDILIKQQIALAITTAGTTQGAGTVLTKYLNELTVVVAAATACVLPAATAGKACVVINNDSADTALIFPAVGEFIDLAAVNINTTLLAGARKHFYCVTAGTWKTATDRGA